MGLIAYIPEKNPDYEWQDLIAAVKFLKISLATDKTI
jgi:hypothetical protein